MRQGLSVLILIASVPCAWAQALVPPAVETFDGKSYAGVVLGETGDPELKAMYRVFKSKLYPEALSILVHEGSHTVDALLDRRGGIAHVQGFLLQYPLGGPSIEELTTVLKEQPTLWYHPWRTEDWHVAAFMKRGIVMFIDETEFGPATRSVLLCRPESVQNGINELLPEPTEINSAPNPGQGWDRIAKVSGVWVSATSNSTVLDEVFKNIRHEVREMAIGLGTGPRVIFVRGSPNVYQVSLLIEHNRRRDSYKISARVSLKSDTPFGDVEESVFHTEQTNVLTQTRVLGVIRAGIVNVNRGLGGQLSRLRPQATGAEEALAIERFLRLVTVPPP